jgi:hypothetical protein
MGNVTTRSSGTLDWLLKDWLAHLEQHASPSTIATYRGYVQRSIVPRLGDKKIDRLKPDDFDRLYVELRAESAWTKTWLNGRHGPLNKGMRPVA